ncbi:MAG TPA: ribonucleoside-diphosphate reductase subunit alpha, partial [Gammaproteobacteria bacterium]|nr:ribonucleoside-diphosphate reductase subunit alpha [Gammaproteobacteria bacterium]
MHTEPRDQRPAPLATAAPPAEKTAGNRSPGRRGDAYRVIRRNGKITTFDASKISVALTKAFLAVEGGQAAASSRIHETVARLTHGVQEALFRRSPDGGVVHIEDIQDHVELELMRSGEHKVARAYVLYRERQASRRARTRQSADAVTQQRELYFTTGDGRRRPLDLAALQARIAAACEGLADVDAERLFNDCLRGLFDGISEQDLGTVLMMAARNLIEVEPDYSLVAARLLLDKLHAETRDFLELDPPADGGDGYAACFADYIHRAAGLQLLDPELTRYDLERLGAALRPERDRRFTYLGLQTLYDRYFIHSAEGVRFELPQAFFMRVAMGLAIHEIDREARAIEFYDLLSSFSFMSSTPTLFNAGTLRPQLSSCYLSTVPDELEGIYSAIRDNALLSKFAGGLGNDWTRVRGLGAHIRGTNGRSQGVVPFLKVANDTAVAVNQGGKRKGAVCAYLEVWHIDIEEFLELRKNTGDERRRTHDMNTASWIPDLFMERVMEDGMWTLFSPEEVPELHELTGLAFRDRYLDYEARAERGELAVSK